MFPENNHRYIELVSKQLFDGVRQFCIIYRKDCKMLSTSYARDPGAFTIYFTIDNRELKYTIEDYHIISEFSEKILTYLEDLYFPQDTLSMDFSNLVLEQ